MFITCVFVVNLPFTIYLVSPQKKINQNHKNDQLQQICTPIKHFILSVKNHCSNLEKKSGFQMWETHKLKNLSTFLLCNSKAPAPQVASVCLQPVKENMNTDYFLTEDYAIEKEQRLLMCHKVTYDK